MHLQAEFCSKREFFPLHLHHLHASWICRWPDWPWVRAVRPECDHSAGQLALAPAP
jgi:hypothetical protein